jgi:hypothetical protein
VQPKPTGELLDPVFAWLKLDETARSYRAMEAFSRAAGTKLLARARAERLRGSILYVRVSSSSWSQQLHALKSQLLEKIRETPGGECVRDLRFNVGDIEELPTFTATRKRASHSASPKPAKSRPPIADELVRAMSDVQDPELRDRLVRLYDRLRK